MCKEQKAQWREQEQGRICLWDGKRGRAAVLIASLAHGWLRLKKYVLGRVIRGGSLVGRKLWADAAALTKWARTLIELGLVCGLNVKSGCRREVQRVLSDSRSFLPVFRENNLHSFLKCFGKGKTQSIHKTILVNRDMGIVRSMDGHPVSFQRHRGRRESSFSFSNTPFANRQCKVYFYTFSFGRGLLL